MTLAQAAQHEQTEAHKTELNNMMGRLLKKLDRDELLTKQQEDSKEEMKQPEAEATASSTAENFGSGTGTVTAIGNVTSTGTGTTIGNINGREQQKA